MQVTQTFHLENEVEQDIVTFPHLTILFFGTIHVSQSIHSAALYSAAYGTNRKATNKQTIKLLWAKIQRPVRCKN